MPVDTEIHLKICRIKLQGTYYHKTKKISYFFLSRRTFGTSLVYRKNQEKIQEYKELTIESERKDP
jgi:hypothetical protein